MSIPTQVPWDHMVLDTMMNIDNRDPSEAILHVWQQQDDDDDVIMQVESDGGLLNLNDFYDSISADTSPPEQLLADAVISGFDSDSSSDTNSFFSCEERERDTPHDLINDDDLNQFSSREFQERMRKLFKSIQKSKATRTSLYAQLPKLKESTVLKRIEDSSRQIDSYCKTALRTM